MTLHPTNQSIRQFYHGRVDECDGVLAEIEQRSSWLSRLRGLAFIPAVASAIYGWAGDGPGTLWYTAALILFAVFIALAAVHENVVQRATEVRLRRKMNRIQLARLEKRWQDVPAPTIGVPDKYGPESRDLDLFGSASVFQLLTLSHTPLGRETLRDWLLEPASPEEIAARQDAVRTLAADARFRGGTGFARPVARWR